MSTIAFRPDYAKFLLHTPTGTWHQYYEALNRASHETRFHGDWLKSHKVVALPSQNPDYELTAIEIWGEWAGLVRSMPFSIWGKSLKRLDIRAIVWDADGDAVLAVGQRLQRADVGYNVETFNSKPASKRHGRDRGGQGFRVGSRKSDVCSVVYKRSGDPVAIEYRFQGQVLRNMLDWVSYHLSTDQRIFDPWKNLVERGEAAGQRRLQLVLERAGIGTYWPVYAKEGRDDYDQLQTSFAAELAEKADEEGHWAWYEEHYGQSAELAGE